MKILQISDLHVTRESTLSDFQKKVTRLVSTIKAEIPEGGPLIILVCGDIVDQGDPSGYPLAKDILKTIEENLPEFIIRFEFTPGNHDINKKAVSKLEEFGAFINEFDKQECNISNSPVVVKTYEGINFAILNSCYEFNTSFGEVKLQNLEEAIKPLSGPVIWVAHHTLFSRYDDDSSSIRNSHSLIEKILSKDSIAYIHGHTHGYSDITIGKKCKVVGVGPLLKSITDINNQFNILTVTGTQLVKIDNYCYRADTNSFIKQTLYENTTKNYFEGSSLIDVYAAAVKNVKASGAITNFHLSLKCQIHDFQRDVEEFFAREIDLAKMWLSEKLPSCMYYNHAHYINKGGTKGLEYVLSELSNKSTSSRAIIPLINMTDVVSSGDGHLPSLDIIQFGFDDESRSDLNLTVYLRALEVNHFLKINISEMYQLVSAVCDKFRSVQSINLNIIAFRAQYREKFGCFMKAKIDFITPHKLTALVIKREVSEIIEMLEEKNSLAETVVNDEGIKSLAAALIETTDGDDYDFYTEDVIIKCQQLANLYNELRNARKRTSIHAEIERIEREISSKLDELVELLKKIRDRHEDH